MNQIGFGIIGTGSIVNTYVKCIEELKQAKLVAIYTKSTNRIKTVENQFGVPAFADMDEFLNQKDLQVVCVCNESGNHGKSTIYAAKAGKHVLCEKPLEVTTQKIDEVIAICNDQQVKLGCALQNRCGSVYKMMERMVREGKLGKLLMGNAHINWYRSKDYYAKNPWRGTMKLDGGAAFMNQGIHTIDLLLNIMGSVKSVFAQTRTLAHEIEGEDVGSAVLSFSNGAIGTITGGTALYPGYPERLEIYGEKGSILMAGGHIVKWNVPGMPAPAPTEENQGSGAANPTDIGHLNHKEVISNMIAAIQEDRKPMVDGKEARKAVEVITSMYQSSKEGKMVNLSN